MCSGFGFCGVFCQRNGGPLAENHERRGEATCEGRMEQKCDCLSKVGCFGWIHEGDGIEQSDEVEDQTGRIEI